MYQLHRTRNKFGPVLIMHVAVTTLVLAGGGLGFWIGQASDLPILAANPTPAPEFTPEASPSVDTLAERSAVLQEVETVAHTVEEMRAELLRINALGARLVEMSGLDPEEFDFDNPPPQGGREPEPVRDYTIKELASELGGIVVLIQDRQRKLDRIEDVITEKTLTARSVPSGWPVHSGYISSRYGFRVHPIRKVRSFHHGVDIASPRGTPILAVADGQVTFSGRKRGYGRVIDIRHRDGLVTRYAHNNANLVKEGQDVQKGQKIATVGSSGSATGPHVHFEVLREGKSIDPTGFLGSSPRSRLAAKDGGSPG